MIGRMGASLGDLRTILQLRRDGLLPARFSVAEIGAQQLSNEVLRDPDIMRAYAEAFGVEPRTFGNAPQKSRAPGVEHLPADAPFTKPFWEWLGCRYVAVDFDASPHVLRLDLNFDDVPQEHRGRYDLVTNFGTTEHVANQIQAMKVIHDLTRPGGIMLHTVPTQGYSAHAMINYTPKFFWALSRSCRYDIRDMRLNFDAEDVPLDPDVLAFVTRHDRSRAPHLAKHRLVDTCLHVIIEKLEDIPFVPPIEVPAGVTDDPAIRQRYWTVLGGDPPRQD